MADARFLDLHGEVDKLYQAPLAGFTAARNALVARIKAAHGADAAAHVKALAKPSITAWTLNQLYWRHQAEFMALLMAGDGLRLAQQQRLGGADVDVAPSTRARQTALDTLLALATDILKEGGHAPSPDMRQRLLGSLDALAAYGTGSLAPRAGRLTEDVPAPGFAALAGLASPSQETEGTDAEPGVAAVVRKPALAPVTLSVVARRSREKAQAAVAQAAAALDTARAEADRAAEALAKAEAGWQAASDGLLAAQKAVGVATTGEQTARADRDERRRDSTRAGIGVRDAEKRLDQVRRSFDQG
ncbi:MAG: hypothetical protein ABIT71_07245 [Vicinamibacteraceae bacterium]